ncbi:hypothetical protein [Salmonirosea aquatica]|uniref:Tetratricopeptide repeat protein n=1 Tax=Salmonirosea aquatica TaxID=2654236 RepID=A0A7C9BGN3_9BACT|nr:hypothetical protein [Cytophagaceae bacterium SJW1-29]
MKKILTISLALFFSANLLFAQSEKYTAAMTAALTDFDKSQNKEPVRDEWLALANRFERIASAEPKEWLPRYYAAYAYSSLAFMGNNVTEKDQLADKAEVLLKEAIAIAGENSELMVLDAQIHQVRLASDPQMRWQTEGPLFAASLAKAKTMDANNPRIYVLEGTSLLYTPEQFGGGKKAARPVLEKAMEKFATFKPQSPLHPSWGEGQAGYMLGEASK